MMKIQLPLKDLIDVEGWQRVQDNFFTVTGVRMRTLDCQGNLVTRPSGEARLCSQLIEGRLKEKFCGKCLPSFLGGASIVDKNLSYSCLAGLHNFVVPLNAEGRILGYVILGPVFLVKRSPKEELLELSEKLGLSLDELWSAVLELKVASFNTAQSLVELIKDVGEHILELAYQDKAIDKVVIALDPAKLNRLLEVLLDVAFQVSGADIGSVMFLDAASETLTIRTSRGLPEEIARNIKVRVGERISGIVAKEGEPLLIDNSLTDERIKGYLNRPYINSSMVLPLRVEEKVIGVMNLAATESSLVRFNKDHLQLINKLIDLATIAIDRDAPS